jgi:predicted nucleic acid-binding Zn ribbon protein
MLISIQKLLPAKLRNLGLKKEFEFNSLKKNWDETIAAALGQAFKGKCQPLSLGRSILTVDCLNSIWANELQMKEMLLLKLFKKEFGDVKIEKIRFIA